MKTDIKSSQPEVKASKSIKQFQRYRQLKFSMFLRKLGVGRCPLDPHSNIQFIHKWWSMDTQAFTFWPVMFMVGSSVWVRTAAYRGLSAAYCKFSGQPWLLYLLVELLMCLTHDCRLLDPIGRYSCDCRDQRVLYFQHECQWHGVDLHPCIEMQKWFVLRSSILAYKWSWRYSCGKVFRPGDMQPLWHADWFPERTLMAIYARTEGHKLTIMWSSSFLLFIEVMIVVSFACVVISDPGLISSTHSDLFKHEHWLNA